MPDTDIPLKYRRTRTERYVLFAVAIFLALTPVVGPLLVPALRDVWVDCLAVAVVLALGYIWKINA